MNLMTRASFCCDKIVRNLHLFLTKVAFMHKHFEWQVFTQVICLQINAKYFPDIIWPEMASFASSLRSMLKLRSTLHEVSWQFNNLACSSGLI